MWKSKLGMSIKNGYKIPTTEVIKMLAEVGFDAVSPSWNYGEDIDEQVRVAREAGLFVLSLHAPQEKIRHIWHGDDAKTDIAIAEQTECMECCRRNNIPIMVLHATSGFAPLESPEIGLKRFDRIVEIAKEKGIKIAIENLQREEYLFALMEYYKGNDTVGFCWDTGHESCYNRPYDLAAMYGDRVIITHLNDNFGISDPEGKISAKDDLHLLPFDGVIDWADIVKKLDNISSQEYLNFEVKMNYHELYAGMDMIEFWKEAYKRACQLAEMLESIRG